MTEAKRDSNGVPVGTGVSKTDGTTILPIKVHPSEFGIIVDDNTTGTSAATGNAKRDNNQVPVLMGVSSADGVTPIPISIDPGTGALLINSN